MLAQMIFSASYNKHKQEVMLTSVLNLLIETISAAAPPSVACRDKDQVLINRGLRCCRLQWGS